MKKRIALIFMLIVSMLCLSVFAVSCKKAETKKYTVSYNIESQEFGSISGTCSSGTKVKQGNSVIVLAIANPGYSFAGWYEDETLVSNQSEYTFSVNKNINLVAKFNVMQYILEYSCIAHEGQIESDITSGSNVDFKTNVTLTAVAQTGYTFDGWYISGEETPVSQNATYSFTMPANNCSIEAKFNVNSYKLNIVFNSSECDIVIAGADNKTYQNEQLIHYNTSLVLTVIEKEGYDFKQIVVGEDILSSNKDFEFNMPAKEYELSVELVPEKRTVNFISQSVILKSPQVDYNTCVDMYQPTRENYEFVGWFTDASLTTPYDFNTKVTDNISLYASWEQSIKTYSVEFIDWNGKRIDAIQTVREGESATIPATPSREGYNFNGWICEDGDYTCVEQNLVVKATYTIKVYQVVFYKDALKTQVYTTQNVEHGQLAKIPSTIIDMSNNLLFDKWIYEDETEFNFQTPIVSDLILVASYKEKPISVYEVKFYANNELVDTQLVEANKLASAPSVDAVEGKKFVGWDNDINAVITQDTVFIAQFETMTFKVKFVDYNQNVLSEQTINYSESAVAPTNPSREGYKFIGWDNSFDNVKEELVITAKYEILSFVATCYDGTNYIDEITADYGQAFAVPTTPTKDGFSFDGWYSDSALTTKYDFTLTATQNISIYAKFEEIVLEAYTVTFYVDNEPISVQEIYSGKDAVAPGVPTKVGHTFISWEGDYTNVTTNVNVSAIFTKNTYNVYFYEQDQITLIDSVVVEYGEMAQAPSAPIVNGYQFMGWSEDLSFVTEEMEVFAVYEKQVITIIFAESDNSVISYGYAKYEGNVSIPRTPSKMGYIFTGWYLDTACTQAFDFSTPITESITLYAGWDKVFDAYTVHFFVNSELYGTIQKVASGKYAIEPALPDGYTVWRVEGTGEIFDFENTPIIDNISLYASN